MAEHSPIITPLFLGKINTGGAAAGNVISLLPAMANRHGLIAGATGTGKTVTLQTLAEQFSLIGTSVFVADVKGDLSGIAEAGQAGEKITQRLSLLGINDWQPMPNPATFWDVYGAQGIPLRTTISEMGPLLLSRILNLNEVQHEVLQVIFSLADDQGLLLLDLKDLRAAVQWVGDSWSEDLRSRYGNVSPATIATILRSILTLEEAGGVVLFGEPALKLSHFMQQDFSGRGVVNVLDATALLQNPRIYSTLLLWLLSELFENLEEVGDIEKPRLVFFFDEAHLLFKDAPPALVEKIEQVVRLIRSKGVGVYFVTQNPLDIPESVLGQLGNRIQHALRAFTPLDQRALRAAAQTFRPNPQFSTEEAIAQLAVGEALVSTLDMKGAPTVVERVWIAPPRSKIGPVSSERRRELLRNSPLAALYSEAVERESAFEILRERLNQTSRNTPSKVNESPASSSSSILGDLFGKATGNKRQGYFESMAKSLLRSVGSTLGREVMRGVLGSMRR